MHRFSVYILVSSLAFVIGSTIALNFYWISNDDSSKVIKIQMPDLTFPERKPWEMPWQIPAHSTEEKEIPTKPFCTDAGILPVWTQLLNDRDFKDWETDARDSLDCAMMLDVKKIDLNRDGRAEILLRGNNSNLCSPVGNCAFWIYEKKDGKYRKLLASTDFWEITEMGDQIQTRRTNDYSDILLKGHFTASDTTYELYKFDGTKYKQSKCSVETPIPGTSDNPKWKFVTCKEFFKRLKN